MRPERGDAGTALQSLRSLRAVPASEPEPASGNRTVYLFLNRTLLFVYNTICLQQ